MSTACCSITRKLHQPTGTISPTRKSLPGRARLYAAPCFDRRRRFPPRQSRRDPSARQLSTQRKPGRHPAAAGPRRWIAKTISSKPPHCSHSKKMWSDARSQARKDREARHLPKAGRYLPRAAATVYRQAYQLSAAELDATTGEHFWPAALQSEKFDQHRARTRAAGSTTFRLRRSASRDGRAKSRAPSTCSPGSLRSELSSVPRDEYLAAQKFLMGLKYTAARACKPSPRPGPLLRKPWLAQRWPTNREPLAVSR